MSMSRHTRRISVVGLGYVGLPVAVAFGRTARVVGFDVNPQRIKELRAGLAARTSKASSRSTATSAPGTCCTPRRTSAGPGDCWGTSRRTR